MRKTTNRFKTRNFLGKEFLLGLNIHQIFYLLNKSIPRKKKLIDLSFNQMNNFVKLYPKKNRLINMVTEYYITIGDFEKIINNDFALLETK